MEQRKILFKAKKLSDGEWIEGDLMQVSEKDIRIYNRDCGGYDISVDPSTVCQFTGLKDREGNDIFEGDLLAEKEFPIYEVGYTDCTFTASFIGENTFIFNLYALSKCCMVCGSKFDRKEGEK